MKRAMVILCMLLTTAVFAAQDDVPDAARAELDAVRQAWSEAYAAADAASLAELYTQDAVLHDDEGEVHAGRDAIRQYYEGALESDGGPIVVESVETLTLGPDVVDFGRWRVEGGPESAGGHYAVWLTEEEGEWRISGHYVNPELPEAPAAAAE